MSLATVDRVLNKRPGVRALTTERVTDAINRLGYIRDVSAANLARQRLYRLVFVVPEGRSQFQQALNDVIAASHASGATERTTITLKEVSMTDPQALIRTLESLECDNLDGVALMAPETPQVRDAISRLKAGGVAVVALLSDLPNSACDHFVGIDNTAAGRTAAVLMGRFVGARSGQILVLASSMLSRDSIDRRLGFDEVMQERFPGLVVLPSVEGHDDEKKMEQLLTTTFSQHSSICGIYTLGSGNRVLTRFIEQRCQDSRPVIIAHEMTPHTKDALHRETIDALITQNLGHSVRSAIRVLRAHSDQVDINEAQERIRIEIVLKENLID